MGTYVSLYVGPPVSGLISFSCHSVWVHLNGWMDGLAGRGVVFFFPTPTVLLLRRFSSDGWRGLQVVAWNCGHM